MEFNQLVLSKLSSTFVKNNLQIIKQSNYQLVLQNKFITISIVHNILEDANYLFLSKNNENYSIEIDNEVLKLFFNTDLKLYEVSTETFIDNLKIFFNEVSNGILKGAPEQFTKLDEFSLNRANQYTHKLILEQSLRMANDEWEKGNYNEYINLIDEINDKDLSSSYKLKYKIAKKKLN